MMRHEDINGGAANTGSDTSHTISVTIKASGKKNYLVLTFNYGGSVSDLCTAVTANGLPMTRIAHATNGTSNESLYAYGLADAPTGTYNIVITLSSAKAIGYVWKPYVGVSTVTSTPDNSSSGTASGTSLSKSLTPIEDKCWVLMAARNDAGAYAAGASTTMRQTVSGGSATLFDSNGPVSPAASRTLVGTSSSANHIYIIFSLKPCPHNETEFVSDGNTRALWHLDGTVASAAKKDNAEGDATWDLNENGTVAAVTGILSEANGAYDCNATGGMYTSTDFTDYAAGAITLACWVKNASPTSGYQFMFAINDAGVETMAMSKSGTSWNMNIDTNGSAHNIAIPEAILEDGHWHWFCATYDGSNVKTYVDGVQYAASVSATGNIRTANPSPLGIGTWGESPGSYRFKGIIDEMLIKATAMTETEIADYYFASEASATPRGPTAGVGIGGIMLV